MLCILYPLSGVTMIIIIKLFMRLNIQTAKEKGFTLLELLIVIAIIAVLATVLVIVINPIETMRKTRDVQRISDLASIRTALAMYLTVESAPSIGVCQNAPGDTPQRVYYSLPSAAGNDANVAGGSGNAVYVAEASVGKIDGTGWIPINLDSMTGGSPISMFPSDPSNTRASAASSTADDLVYRYACATTPLTFELNAHLESIAFGATTEANKHGTDGGNNSSLYEVGTNLNILPSSSDF